MVKIEDSTENAIISSRGNNVIVPKIEPSDDVRPSSGPIILKEEFGASSSSSNLRLQFIEMGFNPNLVDIVLKENGDNDAEIILNELFTRSALENPGAESSISLNELFDSDNEEESKPYTNYTEKRSYLLSMNFSEQQIDSAMQQLGEEAQIEQLVDCIFNSQEENEMKPSINTNISFDEESNTENLYGVAEKSLLLFKMGFTEEEISSAIDKFGVKISVTELADSILANRVRVNTNHIDDSKEHVIINNTRSYLKPENQENQENQETKISFNPSTSNPTFHYQSTFATPNPVISNPVFPNPDSDSRPNKKLKKPIFTNNSTSNNPLKDETNHDAPPGASNPPYFIYGNVIPVSEETWNRLSRFLFNIQPEFLNSQFFSCLNRKEGYIHNLPPQKRDYIIPKSPVSIETALPFTREFWPNWDLRNKFNNNIFGTEIMESRQLCDRLEKMIKNSQNLSNEKKSYVIEKCEDFNLIWVGDRKLGFLEPDQLERVMGYPFDHTRLTDPFDRSKAMRDCFQTDTIGYILSPLKYLFPDGIRILSIYTGIGGAEIGLNRLGLRIKCLVSVDSSETHRKIIKNWWESKIDGDLKGELRQIEGVSKIRSGKIEELIREFGGFDLVIGNWMDWNRFFEFVRVLQRVRSLMNG
ncbi:hypothetical protein LUZ60_003455 [Juncus effusus]|nr:hypothetical protein LUZ60_003444 [Juncus effusus]KAJ3676043.1 hypothetical protein LUZ60_003455 [Juncus effusus]